MSREDSIAKLKKAIDAKRKELGLRKEDSEKYRWMIDILKKKEAAKKRAAPEPRPSPPPRPRAAAPVKPKSEAREEKPVRKKFDSFA